jgi:hypothetical protein
MLDESEIPFKEKKSTSDLDQTEWFSIVDYYKEPKGHRKLSQVEP